MSHIQAGVINNYIGNAPVTGESASHQRIGYLSHLYERVSRLDIAGIKPQGRLNDFTLEQIYIALLTENEARSKEVSATDFEFEHPFAEEADSQSLMQSTGRVDGRRSLSVVEQINQHRRLVLLGAPGSGKSSLVNFVTLCMAGELLGDRSAHLARLTTPLSLEPGEKKVHPEAQLWEHNALIPVHIVLRDFSISDFLPTGQRAAADDLWRYIEYELSRSRFRDFAQPLHQELQKTGGLILFDGLDEVPESEGRRIRVKEAVEDFATAYPRSRVIVTCRPQVYGNRELRLRGFHVSYLAPFNKSQIFQYVDAWTARVATARPSDAAHKAPQAQKLKATICNTPGLFELATHPLFLAHIVADYAGRADLLKSARVKVYEFAINHLLNQGRSRKSGATFTDTGVDVVLVEKQAELRIALSTLAFDAQRDSIEVTIPTKISGKEVHEPFRKLVNDLKRHDPDDKRIANLNGEVIVNYLRDYVGILVEPADDLYRLRYRAFQEFLAACHFHEMDSFIDEIVRLMRVAPTTWREIMLLRVLLEGESHALWALADQLRQSGEEEESELTRCKDVLLAGEVVTECITIAKRGNKIHNIEQLRKELVDGLEGHVLSSIERAYAGRMLNQIDDGRLYAKSVLGMEFCYVPAGDFYLDDKREATIPYGYWMGRFPVTQGQYEKFETERERGYLHSEYWQEAIKDNRWCSSGFIHQMNQKPLTKRRSEQSGEQFSGANLPVVDISWYEAVAFCRWVGKQYIQQQNDPTQQSRWVVRLPTSDEWRKAATGGIQIPTQRLITNIEQLAKSGYITPDLQPNPLPERRFPWGDKVDYNGANCRELAMGTISPIGCFRASASPYGVEELIGNVGEWGQPLAQEMKAPILGGSHAIELCPITEIYWEDTLFANNATGFRVVIAPSQ